jgi:NAD+ synthase
MNNSKEISVSIQTARQKEIVSKMRVQPEIDLVVEINTRITFIKKQLLKSKRRGLVLGISGGVDSVTLGRLAQMAIDELNIQSDSKDYYFIAVRLPYDKQADEEDAQLALNFIKPNLNYTVNVAEGSNGIHQSVKLALALDSIEFDDSVLDFAKGNVKARLRMTAQYEIAGLMNGLVLGTDHSAEAVCGFYTIGGDGQSDLAPLFGLNKRQVRAIAQKLKVPQKLIHKVPTADLETLEPSKADEDVLGVTYNDIDDFLEGRKVSVEVERIIVSLYNNTQHKRDPIYTLYG